MLFIIGMVLGVVAYLAFQEYALPKLKAALKKRLK
jgi:hypothetical protein